MQLTKETAQHLLAGLGTRTVDSHAALTPGYVLDERIAIDKLIGTGGIGEVYQAHQHGVERAVAVKTLRAVRLSDQEQVARFFREAKLMSTLDHPNIARVYALGVQPDGRPYFVLDYISGRPLSELIAEGALQTEDDVVEVFVQVLSALKHSHEKGVVHRDLKPSNILVELNDGRYSVHIVDFGIARSIADDNQSLTRTGTVIGSPMYMSPEQCMGKQPDTRSDLYSVGCVVYEMLAGAPPFNFEEPTAMLRAHVMDEAPSLKKTARFKATARLIRVVENALVKDPAQRYQTAAAMMRDLELLRMGKSIAGSGVHEKRTLSPSRKRLCTKLLSVFLGVTVVASALALFIYQKKQAADFQAKLDRIVLLVQRGETKGLLRRYGEADSLLADAYEQYSAVGAPNKKFLAEILHDRGVVAMMEHRKNAAIDILKQSLNVYVQYIPDDEEGTNTVRYDYTTALMRAFHYREAIPELEKLVKHYEKGSSARARAITLERLIYAYESGQRFEDAARLYGKLSRVESECGVQSGRLAALARGYSAVLRKLRRNDEAQRQDKLAEELDKRADAE